MNKCLTEEYLLIFIDKKGGLYTIENTGKKINSNHYILFTKMDSKLGEDILDSMEIPIDFVNGYELGNHCAKLGYVVIWPTEISKTQNIVASIPRDLTEEQLKSCQILQENLSKYYQISETRPTLSGENVALKYKEQDTFNNPKVKKRFLPKV